MRKCHLIYLNINFLLIAFCHVVLGHCGMHARGLHHRSVTFRRVYVHKSARLVFTYDIIDVNQFYVIGRCSDIHDGKACTSSNCMSRQDLHDIMSSSSWTIHVSECHFQELLALVVTKVLVFFIEHEGPTEYTIITALHVLTYALRTDAENPVSQWKRYVRK